MRNAKNLILCVLMPVLVSTAAVADIHYVNPGESIQAAIDAAHPGDEIEVAPGTYLEAIDFTGKAVRLYSSGGPDVTTIDGTGHYHVVQCVNDEGPGTILEGFTITGGNANGTGDDGFGGGMYNDISSPTVTNCTFSVNNANYYGGGMYNYHSSLTVTNCTFTGNTAYYGGGLSNGYGSSPTVTNCTFTSNTGDYGGGMLNKGSSPTVTDCTFTSNTGDYGGGMCNNGSRPTVTNCIFLNNTAAVDGGGMYNDGKDPAVTNCTFTVNTASQGGGMYNLTSTPTLVNCILWDDSPNEILDDVTSSTTVTYSDVQGGWAGAGNFDICPLFTDADRRLSPYSPCIDAGNDAAVPPGVTTDLDGNPRIQGVCVDMGAFESEFAVIDFSGWVWMETYNDFGYSYNEDDLLYFLSFGHVWYYNITIGQWLISKPMGWVFVDWPYLYVLDTNALVFVLPPESGFWVYHFRTGQWTVSPRMMP